MHIAGSSNGRTGPFGGLNFGSIPSPATSKFVTINPCL